LIDGSNGDSLEDLTLTSPLVPLYEAIDPEVVTGETWPESNVSSDELTASAANDIQVPEPTTLGLLSSGLAALVLIGCLRRAAKEKFFPP